MWFGRGQTYGYLSRASDMIESERRHCACTFRSRSVGTSSCRNAVMRVWRWAQRARRGAGPPLSRGVAGIGALTEGGMPASVISRRGVSKPNPSSRGCVVRVLRLTGDIFVALGTGRSVPQALLTADYCRAGVGELQWHDGGEFASASKWLKHQSCGLGDCGEVRGRYKTLGGHKELRVYNYSYGDFNPPPLLSTK